MASTLTWKQETPTDPNTLTAQAGWVTYYIMIGARGAGGNGTFLVVTGPRGGTRRLNLGNFNTIEKAKQACERHAAGL